MIPSVLKHLEEQPFPVVDELIQNKELAIKETQSHRVILFRWRYRVCKSCSNTFDIENQGMFYKCGECL
jgi:hypothetical protein